MKCEKQLIPFIETMFHSTGNLSIKEFPVRIQESFKRVDVVSAKWLNDTHLEATAVECKLGNDWDAVGFGLNQSIAYQTVFPKVYIAAEASRNDLGHLESVLSILGIGYIQVTSDNAQIELETGKNDLLDRTYFEFQVLNRLGRLVVCSEHWGKDHTRWGPGEDKSKFWISGKEIKKCNYLYQFQEPNMLVSGINFESTPDLKKFFSSTTPAELLKILRKLPQNAYLSISEFSLDKRCRKSNISRTTRVFKKFLNELQLKDLEERFEHARAYNYYIWFLVVKKRNIQNTKPTRSELRREVAKLEKDFGVLYEFILRKIIIRKS